MSVLADSMLMDLRFRASWSFSRSIFRLKSFSNSRYAEARSASPRPLPPARRRLPGPWPGAPAIAELSRRGTFPVDGPRPATVPPSQSSSFRTRMTEATASRSPAHRRSRGRAPARCYCRAGRSRRRSPRRGAQYPWRWRLRGTSSDPSGRTCGQPASLCRSGSG